MDRIPNILKGQMSAAHRNSKNSTANGNDPSKIFRDENHIDWDFEVDNFDTKDEQGIIPENIKAAGALHFIQTLGEVCGIFKVTDAIVYKWATGSLDVPNDRDSNSTASKLYSYYKYGDERSTLQDRKLLYKRVLNRGNIKLMANMIANSEFPRLWKKLIYEFVRFIQKEEDYSSSAHISRKPIYFAIQDLQYNLSSAMGGMALIQTQEIYFHFKDCLGILRDPNIVAQMGNGYRRNMWTVIEEVSKDEFKSLPNVSALRTAATEGQKIFKNLATANSSILQPGNQVFEEMKTSIDLFVTAMGERDNLQKKENTPNPFESGGNPLFRNLPGQDNIGSGGNFLNGLMDSFMPQGQNGIDEQKANGKPVPNGQPV